MSYYYVKITKFDEVSRKTDDYQRIADSGNEKDGGAVYGYVEHDQKETQETRIYSQRVDELNLGAIINAVNGVTK